MKKFTERQTRKFYNEDDTVYKTFWDKEGNCHWGYFTSLNMPFKAAMIGLNKKMLEASGIDDSSKVLDLGCGNGLNSLYIYQQKKAKITGIDLSDERIKNAQKIGKGLKFIQSSATKLPFTNKTFTHVWSQATLYHVHNKKKALQEVSRVLKTGGLLIFDDLIKPHSKVSKDAEKYVYERLLFDTSYNLVSYQTELQKLGFRILYVEDMSGHYALSYLKLADILERKIKNGDHKELHSKYKELIKAYRTTPRLVEKGDIGWALFVAIKE